MSISQNFINQANINHEMITDAQRDTISALSNEKIARYVRIIGNGIIILAGILFLVALILFDFSIYHHESVKFGINIDYLFFSGLFLYFITTLFNGWHASEVSSLKNKFGGWSSSKIKTKEDALEIIKKARNDEVVSLYDLGMMYQHGYFVPVNKKISLAYYAIAAEKGDGLAAYKISQEYKEDGYFKISEQDEYDWLLKGRELGNVMCVKELAQIEGSSNTNNVKSNAAPLLFVGLLFGITVA